MAQFCRATIWFQDEFPRGWTERVYLLQATDLPTAQGLANLWVQKRAQLSATGVAIVRGVVSFDDTFRDSLPLAAPGVFSPLAGGLHFTTYNPKLAGDGRADLASMSLGMRVYEATFHNHANWFMSGLADGYFHDGKFAPSQAWLNAWQDYHDFLTGTGKYVGTNFGFKALDKLAGGAAPKKVLSAAPYTPMGSVLTYQSFNIPNHGYAVGDKFRLSSRKKYWKPLTGVYLVSIVIDANTVACPVTPNGTMTVAGPDFPALAVKQVYAIWPFSDIVFRGPRAHKRGAGFNLGRGRSRVAVSPR